MNGISKIVIVAFSVACLQATTNQLRADDQPLKQKVQPLWKKGIYAKSVPEPTSKNVRYGRHKRNVLDFWQAESDTPTPIVVSIHA